MVKQIVAYIFVISSDSFRHLRLRIVIITVV